MCNCQRAEWPLISPLGCHLYLLPLTNVGRRYGRRGEWERRLRSARGVVGVGGGGGMPSLFNSDKQSAENERVSYKDGLCSPCSYPGLGKSELDVSDSHFHRSDYLTTHRS